MRLRTVSNLRRNGQERLCQKLPKEGSELREVYDLFKNNKGVVIKFSQSSSRTFEDLQNYYGLDIRLIKKGSKKRGSSLYCLVGEFIEDKYVDYLVDKVENE